MAYTAFSCPISILVIHILGEMYGKNSKELLSLHKSFDKHTLNFGFIYDITKTGNKASDVFGRRRGIN